MSDWRRFGRKRVSGFCGTEDYDWNDRQTAFSGSSFFCANSCPKRSLTMRKLSCQRTCQAVREGCLTGCRRTVPRPQKPCAERFCGLLGTLQSTALKQPCVHNEQVDCAVEFWAGAVRVSGVRERETQHAWLQAAAGQSGAVLQKARWTPGPVCAAGKAAGGCASRQPCG